MALGSIQPLTSRNLPGGGGGGERPVRKAYNHTPNFEPIVYKMWEPPRPVTGIALPLPYSGYRSLYEDIRTPKIET
jgi:hypothetical protein